MEDKTVLNELATIERKAKGAGISMDEVCELANIDRSTWTRLKNGQTPRLDTWQRILAMSDMVNKRWLET